MTSKHKESTLKQELHRFAKSEPMKDLMVLHTGVTIATISIYVASGSLVAALVFLFSASLAELFTLHASWIYRNNKDRDNAFRFAVIEAIKPIGLAIVAFIGFIVINYAVYGFINFSIFPYIGSALLFLFIIIIILQSI